MHTQDLATDVIDTTLGYARRLPLSPEDVRGFLAPEDIGADLQAGGCGRPAPVGAD